MELELKKAVELVKLVGMAFVALIIMVLMSVCGKRTRY
jgi:hypothetical protein